MPLRHLFPGLKLVFAAKKVSGYKDPEKVGAVVAAQGGLNIPRPFF
ncbi:MAG: hypothetical protein K5905_14210 [Roseibium sp.]|nr:hypothetical protein [Roseibium sp.]MCV0426618.1 hypothetical protein [Roseibium sp.]